MTTKLTNADLVKAALMSGGMNAVINGLINWFQVKGKSEIFLTVDSISNTEHTVLGGAVILASSLAAILTIISYFTLKTANKPAFYPRGFWLTIRNAFFAFGVMVTLSIILQRMAGAVTVTPLVAVIVTGLIAGVVAGVVDYMTKTELIN